MVEYHVFFDFSSLALTSIHVDVSALANTDLCIVVGQL